MVHSSRGPYKILATKEVYRNPWICVHEDQVIRPGGLPGYFGTVEMKEGSSVLAVDKSLNVFLVREYKYAVSRFSVEVVSGAVESGETPLDAARRELREEVGLHASEWVNLGAVDPFTTVVRSPNYMFLASALTQTTKAPDEGEVLDTIRIPFDQAVQMVVNGEITHAASCVLILKAERYFRSTGLLR